MQTYTKINTLYRRFAELGKYDLPNPKWKIFQNKIIIGAYSDNFMGYIKDLKFDCFSKVDGTNAKIAYYPSTGEIKIGGKTDNADIKGNGLEAFLIPIAERIKPILAELFPPECAKFTPIMNDKKQPKYLNKDFYGEEVIPDHDDIYAVMLEESPIYFYGEFFGKKVQKGGNYDKDNNRFSIFDICQQGWYVPIDVLNQYAEKLGLDVVPYIGQMSISEAEDMVKEGFKTLVPNVSNPNYLEEGIVARPVIPIKDPRGKRIIVKIKTCDYRDLERAISSVGDESYREFCEWYFNNVEPKE